MKMNQYQYIECGLDNIWLDNGFEYVETPYGNGVSIQNLDGLHKAIGCSIAENPNAMTAKELKFLRREMDLTQARLASLIGADEQSIHRWENGKSKISGPAARMVSMVYLSYAHDIQNVRERIEAIAALDKHDVERKILSLDEEGWEYDIAA